MVSQIPDFKLFPQLNLVYQFGLLRKEKFVLDSFNAVHME